MRKGIESISEGNGNGKGEERCLERGRKEGRKEGRKKGKKDWGGKRKEERRIGFLGKRDKVRVSCWKRVV